MYVYEKMARNGEKRRETARNGEKRRFNLKIRKIIIIKEQDDHRENTM